MRDLWDQIDLLQAAENIALDLLQDSVIGSISHQAALNWYSVAGGYGTPWGFLKWGDVFTPDVIGETEG